MKLKRDFFLPYQARWINDDALIKVWEKSRRIGATFCQAYEDVRDIIQQTEYTPGRPVRKVYFSSKDEEAGREYILDYCRMYARMYNAVANDLGEQVVDVDTGARARVLEFENEGRIHALSSSPTAFNSKGGKIVWDEAALHKDQRNMWSGAQPAALVWGYPIRILSTHKGKQTLFYRFVKNTKAGDTGWSLHRVTIVDAVNEGLYDRVTGRETSEAERAAYIENIRKSCQSEEIFQEDYMANPQDSTTAFITYEVIDLCESSSVLRTLEHLAQCGNPLYGGWDIGRQRDLSVIPILEDLDPILFCRYIKSFDKTPFRLQKQFLKQVMSLPKLRRMCVDQTGMGIPLTEEAQEKYGTSRVEGVTFTNANKEVLAVDMKNKMDDRHLILPDDNQLRESIHSIKRMVTAAGNVRFDAERTDETGHADHFWALALAVHAKTGGATGPTWAASAPSPDWNPFYDKFGPEVPLEMYT